MKITDVEIKLANERDGKIRAFATIIVDGIWAIHDFRILERHDGTLIVACPSRKVCDRCPACSGKNPLKQSYCGDCGRFLSGDRPQSADTIYYRDVAHPIRAQAREDLMNAVLAAYSIEIADAELARSGRAVAC